MYNETDLMNDRLFTNINELVEGEPEMLNIDFSYNSKYLAVATEQYDYNETTGLINIWDL